MTLPRQCILVIEYEKPVGDIIASMLNAADFDVHQASTGQEAMDLLKSGVRIDLVTSCLLIADVDGLTLLCHVKQNYPHIRFVTITAVRDDSVRKAMLRNGADGFLLKPFERHQLLEIVRSALDRKQQKERRVGSTLRNKCRSWSRGAAQRFKAGLNVTAALLAIASHWFKILFVIGLAFGALAFAVWWMLPDDSRMKYAAEYVLDSDQVMIERKPHNCEWDSAPIGNKHCHYDAIVVVYNSDHQVVGGTGLEVNGNTMSYDGGKTWKETPENARSAKVYVTWRRIDD